MEQQQRYSRQQRQGSLAKHNAQQQREKQQQQQQQGQRQRLDSPERVAAVVPRSSRRGPGLGSASSTESAASQKERELKKIMEQLLVRRSSLATSSGAASRRKQHRHSEPLTPSTLSSEQTVPANRQDPARPSRLRAMDAEDQSQLAGHHDHSYHEQHHRVAGPQTYQPAPSRSMLSPASRRRFSHLSAYPRTQHIQSHHHHHSRHHPPPLFHKHSSAIRPSRDPAGPPPRTANAAAHKSRWSQSAGTVRRNNHNPAGTTGGAADGSGRYANHTPSPHHQQHQHLLQQRARAQQQQQQKQGAPSRLSQRHAVSDNGGSTSSMGRRQRTNQSQRTAPGASSTTDLLSPPTPRHSLLHLASNASNASNASSASASASASLPSSPVPRRPARSSESSTSSRAGTHAHGHVRPPGTLRSRAVIGSTEDMEPLQGRALTHADSNLNDGGLDGEQGEPMAGAGREGDVRAGAAHVMAGVVVPTEAAIEEQFRVSGVEGRSSSLALHPAQAVEGDDDGGDGIGGVESSNGERSKQRQGRQRKQTRQNQHFGIAGQQGRYRKQHEPEDDFAAVTDPSIFVGNVHNMCPRPSDRSAPEEKEEEGGDTPTRGHLIFDASFESGNLGKVECISPAEYNLYIRPDLASPRHRLWFYFRVSNNAPSQHVLFNVLNFSKTRSLFSQGMAPVFRSQKRPTWRRIDPGNVFHYKPDAAKRGTAVMAFAVHFDGAEDVYEVAYSFPYTYTRLQRRIGEWKLRHRSFLRHQLLGSSLQGRKLDLLTITAPKNVIKMRKGQRLPSIFITARVHPGETPASFVCEGLIQHLLSQDPQVVALRNRVVVHVIPMLNPDGVFHGTYRCNTLGFDLNRCWDKAFPNKHPTITAMRSFLAEVKASSKVLAFVDLHGHSTALSAFIYGNEYTDAARMQAQWGLPRALSRASDMFSLARTKFNSDAKKAGTGRRWIGSMLGAEGHSFTLETSFFGFLPDYCTQIIPFEMEDYTTLGAHTVQALGACYLPQLDDEDDDDANNNNKPEHRHSGVRGGVPALHHNTGAMTPRFSPRLRSRAPVHVPGVLARSSHGDSRGTAKPFEKSSVLNGSEEVANADDDDDDDDDDVDDVEELDVGEKARARRVNGSARAGKQAARRATGYDANGTGAAGAAGAQGQTFRRAIGQSSCVDNTDRASSGHRRQQLQKWSQNGRAGKSGSVATRRQQQREQQQPPPRFPASNLGGSIDDWV